MVSAASGTQTAAAATSGSTSVVLYWNSVGTTLWSTLVDQRYPTTTAPLRATSLQINATRPVTYFLGRLYEIGDLNLTTSTSEFTHHSATFPMLANRFGQASQPVDLIPLISVTTATTVTAAAFTIDYTKDGGSVTGTTTHTMPAAATAIGSTFVLPLEEGDSTVRDITNINITTTSTVGAAKIWGLKPICFSSTPYAVVSHSRNLLSRPTSLPSISPATATSGTATSHLVIGSFGTSATTTVYSKTECYEDY